MNDSNQAASASTENREGSNRAKENAVEARTVRAQQRGVVSTGLDRVRQAEQRKVEFGRWAIADRRGRGEGKPETFDFLGFTHIGEINRKSGRFVVRRKTVRKRMRAKPAEIKKQLRARNARLAERDRGVAAEGGARLFSIPRGAGKPAHAAGLLLGVGATLAAHAEAARSEASDELEPVYRLPACYLPPPRCCHPFPSVHFAASHPR